MNLTAEVCLYRNINVYFSSKMEMKLGFHSNFKYDNNEMPYQYINTELLECGISNMLSRKIQLSSSAKKSSIFIAWNLSHTIIKTTTKRAQYPRPSHIENLAFLLPEIYPIRLKPPLNKRAEYPRPPHTPLLPPLPHPWPVLVHHKVR